MAEDEQRDEERPEERGGAVRDAQRRGRGKSSRPAEEPRPRARAEAPYPREAAGGARPPKRRLPRSRKPNRRRPRSRGAGRQGAPVGQAAAGRRARADRDRARARAERRGARPPRGRGGGAGPRRRPRRPPRPARSPRRRASPPSSLPSEARIQATGKRKSSIARVVVRAGAAGFEINSRSLEEYFPRHQHQTLVRQPLVTSGYDGKVDVAVRVHGGGIAGQAGAVRHGIARALTEIDPELRGELKRRGLLTRDARAKERRKAGLKKARKRPQFSKR